MQPDKFMQLSGVSRETYDKLEIYHALLLKWQKAINLVSPATLDDAWSRHFLDSAQLAQYIPEDAKILADLGAGAGFPGLVLAAMRPEIDVHLIESDERKAQFLRTVSRETGAEVTVHDERIECLPEDFVPDAVTARALKDLRTLCHFCVGWAAKNPDLTMVFPKGKNALDEINNARTLFNFNVEIKPSMTDPAGHVLVLSALSPTA